jgi:hypothetical protein
MTITLPFCTSFTLRFYTPKLFGTRHAWAIGGG